MNEKLAAAIADAQGISDDAEQAAKTVETDPVPKVVTNVVDVFTRWKNNESTSLLAHDAELMLFHRDAFAKISVLLMDAFELTLTKLRARIEEGPADGEAWSIHELLRIIEALGTQVANFKAQATKKGGNDDDGGSTAPPARAQVTDESDLDRILEEKRRALAAKGVVVEVEDIPVPEEENPS